jgi:hypothetical protein
MKKHKNISLGCGKLKILGLSLLISVSPVLSVLAETKSASCKDNCDNAYTKEKNANDNNKINTYRKIVNIQNASNDDFLADAVQNTGKCGADYTNEVAKCKSSNTLANSQNDGLYRQSLANANFQLNNAVISRDQYQTTTNTIANKWLYQNLDNTSELEKCKNDKTADHTRCLNLGELSYNSNCSKAASTARKSRFDADEIHRIKELEYLEALDKCLIACGS